MVADKDKNSMNMKERVLKQEKEIDRLKAELKTMTGERDTFKEES